MKFERIRSRGRVASHTVPDNVQQEIDGGLLP
jgi:hypothetical protein